MADNQTDAVRDAISAFGLSVELQPWRRSRGAQALRRSGALRIVLRWSAGTVGQVLFPHTGSFLLYITSWYFAPAILPKSSHFATVLPLLAEPPARQTVPQL